MTDVESQPDELTAATTPPTAAVAVVDFGSGNIGSILNMFRRLGVDAVATRDPAVLRSAPRLVLPGVGAFDGVMSKLNASGLIPLLEQRVLVDRVPMLGICVGLQLLAKRSEEGDLPGLGWIDAEVRRLPDAVRGEQLRIPHMGWSRTALRKESAFLPSLASGDRFYFVHSYAVVCNREDDVLALAHYGEPFVAAIEVDNIVAVQFHPEKSHRHGLAVLRDFAR